MTVPVVLPVKLAEHVADPPLPDSVQLVFAGDTPAPLADKLTDPVGVVFVPVAVSLTVTVQLLAAPGTTGLAQLTTVDVERPLTVNVAERLLLSLFCCVATTVWLLPKLAAGTMNVQPLPVMLPWEFVEQVVSSVPFVVLTVPSQ